MDTLVEQSERFEAEVETAKIEYDDYDLTDESLRYLVGRQIV